MHSLLAWTFTIAWIWLPAGATNSRCTSRNIFRFEARNLKIPRLFLIKLVVKFHKYCCTSLVKV